MVDLRLSRRLRAGPIEVACAADPPLLAHAAAMLHSLLVAGDDMIHVHLLAGDDFDPDVARPLSGMVGQLGGELSLHQVPHDRLAGIREPAGPQGDAERRPPARWQVILLPELLAEVDRVLFLDIDLIVLDSLRPLWRTRLSRHLVGAVTTVFPSPESGERRCARLGIDPGDHFDTGVMVLDLVGLRREGIAERILEFARSRGPGLCAGDSINAILAPHRRAIEPRWNCTDSLVGTPEAERVFGAKAAAKAVRDPAIRHFGGHGEEKPWRPRAACEARELYWRHRNQTPWASGRDLNHPWGEFFPGFRQSRRDRYAGRRIDRGRRRAVQTIVHNEAVFLPIWLRYHRRFFAPEDIYVFDHESTDGSTSGGGFVRIPVTHDTVDHTWMVTTLQAHQHELLERYDVVLTLDVDEVVVPDPDPGTLGDYLDRFDEEYVNCLGYELLHVADEPALDPDRPILDQRRWWFANDGYDKPALATQPTVWEPGFHSLAEGHANLDPDLRLIHLHRMDYAICRERHRHRRAREWNQRDVAYGWANHNLLAEGEEFDRWFYEDSSFEGISIELERIPARWRGLV
jgi:lipopolysaccharide biosynthesis glycosyltransferase